MLYGMGIKNELFATRYRKRDVYSPRHEWHTHTLTPLQMMALCMRLADRLKTSSVS